MGFFILYKNILQRRCNLMNESVVEIWTLVDSSNPNYNIWRHRIGFVEAFWKELNPNHHDVKSGMDWRKNKGRG